MLTDADIRAAKPRQKAYKLYDERQLYLLIKPSGARLWRQDYTLHGRRNTLGLGGYPDVGLKIAREKAAQIRKQVAAGEDPSVKRKLERTANDGTFKTVAVEFLSKQATAAVTKERDAARLENFIYPSLGNRPIALITAPELLVALRRIESNGTHETARRTRALCGRVFRYGIAIGVCEKDVAADLQGALTAVTTQSYASLTDLHEIGQLLLAIDGYKSRSLPATGVALRILPYVWVRNKELRHAQWSEFNLHKAEWRIPGERMKMDELHIVPLARQVVAILRDWQVITGGEGLVFQGLTDPHRPISDGTLNAALRRLGYSSDEQTPHGFRTIASTVLNEMGYNRDWIEIQLAHGEHDKVRGVYNAAEYMLNPKTGERPRPEMMQAYADFLDDLKARAAAARPTLSEAA